LIGDVADLPLGFLLTCWTLLGLLVGSFLNVVIHRVPIMMERQWAHEHALTSGDLAATEAIDATPQTTDPYNLLVPGSACPACHAPLRWWHNIPILSYVLQKGRCRFCQATISRRYPIVELVCAALFLICAVHFGGGLTTLAWAGFCATLLAAALIDQDTTWLPDVLTLPLLWAGLLLAALRVLDLPLTQAVWGAAWGYSSLWTVYWLFKWVTGKEGMGYGDFKLLAAMGAWLGPVALIPLTLLACVLGASVGIGQILSQRRSRDQAMPFGPYLAFAGVIMVFYKVPVLVMFGLAP
jgi:leader peptidase (prepilin peptidase)/N-methyltransferase